VGRRAQGAVSVCVFVSSSVLGWVGLGWVGCWLMMLLSVRLFVRSFVCLFAY